ncbi:Hypothetical_protein [Hexamita inflata]|uniref:Hypothetical_protein n=1 Tax=Hexamita inflata TaxID=28002 RepID=A0AA86QD15_9EUKA|nr:Hypothetical protein HINF_LOCUS40253 [Hexamita inflata]
MQLKISQHKFNIPKLLPNNLRNSIEVYKELVFTSDRNSIQRFPSTQNNSMSETSQSDIIQINTKIIKNIRYLQEIQDRISYIELCEDLSQKNMILLENNSKKIHNYLKFVQKLKQRICDTISISNQPKIQL